MIGSALGIGTEAVDELVERSPILLTIRIVEPLSSYLILVGKGKGV